MIESLAYSATFAKSGAAISGVFQPKTGITAVVGKNGTGKTFGSIECLRWALYGKDALRGMAADYKSAEVTARVRIKGACYTIRRGAKEDIKHGDTTLAVGAEKVTEKVIELMGYDLSVFDICNAATQGDVQKLGKLKPAERKKLIDRVLSLTDVEKTEKDCRQEALGYKREAEALTSALRAPGEEPKPPLHYLPSASARDRLNEMRKVYDEAARLGRLISHVTPLVAPDLNFQEAELHALENHEQVRLQVEARREQFDRAAKRVTVPMAEEDIVKAVAKCEWERQRAQRGPEPQLTAEKVAEYQATWREIHALRQVEDMEVECPNCEHRFHTRSDMPPEPPCTERELAQQLDRIERWKTPLPPEPAGHWSFDEREAEKYREANRALEELAKLGSVVDRSAELRAMQQLSAQWDAYWKAQDQYQQKVAENDKLNEQLKALEPVPSMDDLDKIHAEYRASEVYENSVDAYDREVKAFEEMQAKVAEKRGLSEKFAVGAAKLAAARAKVKALLAPRISRIASALLSDMTAGKLTSIEVDDEMEISVGGQRLETLSGAGMTVANLALRVAMGQALTAGTFPVFLGDEIDGDLDEERREATTQALAALKDRLRQVILVTHKNVDIADQVWHVT